MIGKLFRSAFAAVLLVTCAKGAIITVPPGLNPGDAYRLIFVTSGTSSPASTDIATYNTFVNNAANAVGVLSALGATWSAVASTAGTGALTNIGASSAPIYLLTGIMVANNTTDLFDGSIAAGVNRTELDTAYSGQVWTGTLSGGAAGNPLGGATITAGLSTATDGGWMNNAQLSSTQGSLPLYGISSVLTVPTTGIPEPGTVGIVFAGLLGIAGVSRARRIG